MFLFHVLLNRLLPVTSKRLMKSLLKKMPYLQSLVVYVHRKTSVKVNVSEDVLKAVNQLVLVVLKDLLPIIIESMVNIRHLMLKKMARRLPLQVLVQLVLHVLVNLQDAAMMFMFLKLYIRLAVSFHMVSLNSVFLRQLFKLKLMLQRTMVLILKQMSLLDVQLLLMNLKKQAMMQSLLAVVLAYLVSRVFLAKTSTVFIQLMNS